MNAPTQHLPSTNELPHTSAAFASGCAWGERRDGVVREVPWTTVGADRQTFELSWKNARHGADARVISDAARELVRAYSWADHALYEHARVLIKRRG